MNQATQQQKTNETAFYIYFAFVITGIILFSFIIGRFSNFYSKGTPKFNIDMVDGNLVKISVAPDGNSWITTKDSAIYYIENY